MFIVLKYTTKTRRKRTNTSKVGTIRLVGRADFPDLAFVHEEGDICHAAGEAHLMGHEHHRHAALAQILHHL